MQEARIALLREELVDVINHSDDYDFLSALQDAIYQIQSGVPPEGAEAQESKQLLDADLRQAARTMSPKEARYNVDLFYQTQGIRKRIREQVRSMDKDIPPEPHQMLDNLFTNSGRLERRIFQSMDAYTDGRLAGRWAKSNYGIGPVLAGGLTAHVDITKAPTVGHIWRFAGLDPTVEWLGTVKAENVVKEICGTDGWARRAVTDEELAQVANEVNRKLSNIRSLAEDKETGLITPKSLAAATAKRPYSNNLHVLCWKMGDCFFKFHRQPACFYGHILADRWDLEKQRNEAFMFREQAEKKLETTNLGQNTDAYKAYSQGKLPASRILLRAQRYAVKIFLTHFHYVEYLDHYGVEPPKPYVLTLPGHDTEIKIPNWPMD